MKTAIPELNNFCAWSVAQIKNSIECGQPVRVPKNWELLQSTLDSGLIEEVPHHPDYTRHVHVTPKFIA